MTEVAEFYCGINRLLRKAVCLLVATADSETAAMKRTEFESERTGRLVDYWFEHTG